MSEERQEEKQEEREVVTYSYMRGGVRYHTPHEDIAILRAEDGEYLIERTKISSIK